MSRSKWDGRIPFVGGSPVAYAEPWRDGFEWRDNFEFDATLLFQGYVRGRSAARIQFEVVDFGNSEGEYLGMRVEMFMSDFSDAVQTLGFKRKGGKALRGRWTFGKQGSNFGLKMVKPDA